MANVIKPKRSNTASNVPTTANTTSGELAVNMADKKIYINNGTSIVQVGAGTLSSLSGVTITSPATNQVLQYNGTNWVNATASGSGTVTSITAGTGLSGGTITTTGTIALANTAVTAGSYTTANITVDAQGRITAASSGTSGVSSVTGTAPIASSGGSTPAISISQATTSTNGYLSSTDWNTFNNKTSNTGTVTSVAMTVPTGLSISGTPITTSGTLAVTLTAGYSIPTTASQTNWDTAYSVRQQWTGGSTNLVAATGRTSLGGTTVGQNFFTLANPTAITFPRINADNTVSALDAATFRTAIGAGTSSTTGTVTSVAGTGTVSGLTLTGTVTTSGSLTLGGTLSLTSGNVTTALGYTPYNATNPNSYIALASAITGYTAGTNTALVATDTLLAALGKLQGQVTARGTGTVTSVGGTGTVNGLTLTGTVTTTGNLTLGGTLSGVSLTSQVSGTLPVANGGTGATTSTGSGAVVLATSPTLTTPNLGTPSAINLTNATALPHSALPSGSVLKVQQFADNGSSTTSTSIVNLNATYFSYTPVSTNSTLHFMVTFYLYQGPTNGYGASSYGYYQIGEVLSGTPTAFSNAGYIWCYQYSTTYTQSNAQTGVVMSKRTNSSLSTRQFNLMGATTYPNVSLNALNITMTITEVAN